MDATRGEAGESIVEINKSSHKHMRSRQRRKWFPYRGLWPKPPPPGHA